MARKKSSSAPPPADSGTRQPISLKQLAAHLDLSPTTLSLVLNNSKGASSIPEETKARIFDAARRFNYRPNSIARSLRSQRTHTLGVLVPEMSDGYSTMVLSGLEEYLLREGFFYFIASHRHNAERIEQTTRLFLDRCVEGLILVDTPECRAPGIPVVSVSGHDESEEVTNIILNHERAAELAVEHLVALGHERIAVVKGQEFSSDTNVRWSAIERAAERMGVPIDPTRIAQLEGDDPTPGPGFIATSKLLARGCDFTALFSFNDISAIGAIMALRRAGLDVPDDVSVIGFDDTLAAMTHTPGLTTIRQPLKRMGEIAAEHVLRRIADGPENRWPHEVTVEPELVVRESTAAALAVASTVRARATR
jgi:LacI family transcriptional regulator